jgi:hypothetical protein
MESETEHSEALQRILEDHARDQIAPPSDNPVEMAIRDIRQEIVKVAEVWEPILKRERELEGIFYEELLSRRRIYCIVGGVLAVLLSFSYPGPGLLGVLLAFWLATSKSQKARLRKKANDKAVQAVKRMEGL